MNRRHSDYKSDALPTELHRLNAASEEKAAASENTTKSNYFVQADRLQIKTNSIDTSRKIVGAENEQEKFASAQGDNVYINPGANSGVKVGDKFVVIRSHGRVETRWSKKRNPGFYVQEVGSLEAVKVKMICEAHAFVIRF